MKLDCKQDFHHFHCFSWLLWPLSSGPDCLRNGRNVTNVMKTVQRFVSVSLLLLLLLFLPGCKRDVPVDEMAIRGLAATNKYWTRNIPYTTVEHMFDKGLLAAIAIDKTSGSAYYAWLQLLNETNLDWLIKVETNSNFREALEVVSAVARDYNMDKSLILERNLLLTLHDPVVTSEIGTIIPHVDVFKVEQAYIYENTGKTKPVTGDRVTWILVTSNKIYKRTWEPQFAGKASGPKNMPEVELTGGLVSYASPVDPLLLVREIFGNLSQSTLTRIATESHDLDARLFAVSFLTNQDSLITIASDAPNGDKVRIAVGERVKALGRARQSGKAISP